jgi:hypothetical protein
MHTYVQGLPPLLGEHWHCQYQCRNASLAETGICKTRLATTQDYHVDWNGFDAAAVISTAHAAIC